jgi:hypothetical protein
MHFFDSQMDHEDMIEEAVNRVTLAHATVQRPHKPDYEALRPLFAWIPAESVEKIKATTQYARATVGTVLKHAYKTPFTACNVRRRNKAVATDTVYADVPAIDCGHTSAQIFVGRDSLVTDIVGMSTVHRQAICQHAGGQHTLPRCNG